MARFWGEKVTGKRVYKRTELLVWRERGSVRGGFRLIYTIVDFRSHYPLGSVVSTICTAMGREIESLASI